MSESRHTHERLFCQKSLIKSVIALAKEPYKRVLYSVHTDESCHTYDRFVSQDSMAHTHTHTHTHTRIHMMKFESCGEPVCRWMRYVWHVAVSVTWLIHMLYVYHDSFFKAQDLRLMSYTTYIHLHTGAHTYQRVVTPCAYGRVVSPCADGCVDVSSICFGKRAL